MIVVDNLSKNYGKQALFDNISFKVNRRERVGVVGRNGHGKTTLVRMIAGLEEADSGSISMPRNYRIGYVEQHLDFKTDSVMDEAARGLSSDAVSELWRVEKVMAGLGFDKNDLNKHPSELSGGYQVRLNLAKVLLADYQMLLLDEPNNYLDITSIRWLERFLLAWPGELMLITHDRSFMDKVVTHVLGIHRRKARKISGDTGRSPKKKRSTRRRASMTSASKRRWIFSSPVFGPRRDWAVSSSRGSRAWKRWKRETSSRPSGFSNSLSLKSPSITSTP
jgi:ATP-binding cassette subfamily F protein 3